MNSLSPKKRFLNLKGTGTQSPADLWGDMMTSEQFQNGLQIAWADFCMRERSGNAVEATQSYYRIEGARDMISSILNLGDVKEAPTARQALKPLTEV